MQCASHAACSLAYSAHCIHNLYSTRWIFCRLFDFSTNPSFLSTCDFVLLDLYRFCEKDKF